MPRPKSKTELQQLSRANYQKLMEMVDGFEPHTQENDFPPGTMNRNIRDVLAHLHHWHLMFKEWYDTGMSGMKPEMPAKGYTWKTAPELNRKIWEQYRHSPLSEVKQKLATSHQSVCELIDSHTNEELFEKKRYKWTGSTSLGAYLVSATSSHYDWATKLIKKASKGWS